MNNENTEKLRGVVEMLVADSSRINESKPQKYWYPLSMATYGTEEILEALDSLCSFRTTMWEKTQRFEDMFCAHQPCYGSVMVNSGSSADLLLSFLLKKKVKGGKVLIPAVTWPTQIWSIIVAGFTPVLVDVDPKTLNIDYKDLERKIDKETVAIFLVHLMGNPCDMDRVQHIANMYDLLVLEDCCEGLGASFGGNNIGNFGIGGAFSFFFSHHITTMEGGMVVCHSEEDDTALRVLRAHGWTRNTKNVDLSECDVDPRYAFVDLGFNLRPTDLQAGFGLHQMKKLEEFNNRRDEVASVFFNYIESTDWADAPEVHHKAKPSWLGLPIMIKEEFADKRDIVMECLEKAGIETRPIVTGNVAKHPVASKYPEIFSGTWSGADEVHRRGLYIGLSPMQSNDAIHQVIAEFEKIRRDYL